MFSFSEVTWVFWFWCYIAVGILVSALRLLIKHHNGQDITIGTLLLRIVYAAVWPLYLIIGGLAFVSENSDAIEESISGFFDTIVFRGEK